MDTLHSPLKAREFRVLRFKLEDERIEATLDVVNLDMTPEYIALSYTWQLPQGSLGFGTRDHAKEPIFVNGVGVIIQANLSLGLTRLLSAIIESGLPVFIDALCIDQQSNEEKSQQVSMMRSIYENAQAVWAWVGEPVSEYEAGLALWMINMCYKMQNPGDAQPEIKNEHLRPDGQSLNHGNWLAIIDLLRMDYWKRTWILQEMTGPAPTMFWYGKYSFRREEFFAVIDLAPDIASGTSLEAPLLHALGISSTAQRLQRLADMRTHQKLLFLYLLDIMRESHCSDPRDKVFAPRALAGDVADGVMEPDYTKSVEEVYMDIALFHMQHATVMAGMRMTHLVGHPSSGFAALTPTWVPDWSCPLPDVAAGMPEYNACNGVWDPAPQVQDRSLTVWGKRVDILQFRTYVAPPADPRAFRDFEPANSTMTYLSSGETMVDAFLRTVVCDGRVERRDTGQWTYRRGAKMDWTIYDRHPSSDTEDEERRRRQRSSAQITSNNRTYGTSREHGYMGMFPVASRVGDLIVVVAGGTSAYVLRERGGIEGRWSFIGQCYVHGIMDGEAMNDGKDLEKFVLE